jgi:uncharacterized membrane-anchored protein
MLESSEQTRKWVMLLTAALILGTVNWHIAAKQRIVERGATVLLALAPRDPRSLLQGDYMALRYAMADRVASRARARGLSDGRIVVGLDPQGVARFERIHDGGKLATGEQLLQFRRRGDTVRLASDAYFFEEGRGEHFSAARYGELRVDADGSAVLMGLRSGEFQRLGPSLH